MAQVAWRRRAVADLHRIAKHIADENPLAARRVLQELLLAGDSLTEFPRRGRPGRVLDVSWAHGSWWRFSLTS